jgi:hypothetical protein
MIVTYAGRDAMDAAVPARLRRSQGGFPVSDRSGAQTNGNDADGEVVWS